MKFLLLGFSSIARRRVLPAMARAASPEIDIASRTLDPVWPPQSGGTAFRDYEEALSRSTAEAVYISTRNHEHAELTALALESGRHTVVDKPAFLSISDTERLLNLAARRCRCLAEATVYPFHPQMNAIRDLFDGARDAPTTLAALFSFPPLPPDNFRYCARFGGGALLDLGPYAITPGRLFFGEPPESVTCSVVRRQQDVESAFSVLMTYSHGRSMTGHFGYTTAYRNQLQVLGPQVAVSLERAFTTPPDMPLEIEYLQRQEKRTLNVPAADSFEIFLAEFVRSAEAQDHERWGRDLLADALALDRLRSAALRQP